MLTLRLAGGTNISHEAQVSDRVRPANASGPSPHINTAIGRSLGFDQVHKNVCAYAFTSSK